MQSSEQLIVSTMDTIALLECLKDNGVSREEILERSGFDISAQTSDQMEMTLDSLLILWEMAEEVTHDPAIAIHLRKRYGKSHIHFVNYIALYSSNYGNALYEYTRFGRLFCQAFDYQVVEVGNDIQFTVCVNSSIHQNRWIPEFHLSLPIHMARLYGIELNDIIEIRFQHSCPTTLAEYESYFCAPVQFDAGENAMVVTQRWLNTPIPTHNPKILNILKEQANAAIADQKHRDPLSRQVERLILENISSGVLSIDMVANSLKIHRSTLHRKLQETGTSFQELLRDIRKNLSVYYLNQGLKLDQIAYLLGYANSSGFQAAFKTWFGKTPGSLQRS